MRETPFATRTCPAPSWWTAAPTAGNTATFSLPVRAEDLASRLSGISGVEAEDEDEDADGLEELLGIVDPSAKKRGAVDPGPDPSPDPDGLEELLGIADPPSKKRGAVDPGPGGRAPDAAFVASPPPPKRQRKEKDVEGLSDLVEADVEETIAATTAVLARGIDALFERLQGIPVEKLGRSLASLRADTRSGFERRGVTYD